MLTKVQVENAVCAAVRKMPEYPEGLTSRLGTDAEETDVPVFIARCARMEEICDPSGNYLCDVYFTVMSESDRQEPGDNPAGAHETRWSAIFGAVKERAARTRLETGGPAEADPCLAQRITAEGVYCYDEIEDLGADPSFEGRKFCDSHGFRMLLCAEMLS